MMRDENPPLPSTSGSIGAEEQPDSANTIGAAVDELPHLIWMSDPEGRLTFSNKVVYDYVGDDVDAATSAQHWIKLVHTEDRDGFIQIFRENVQARRPFHATCRVQRMDGAWRWIETHAHARFNAGGVFLGHVGASVDITEHRNAPAVPGLVRIIITQDADHAWRAISPDLPGFSVENSDRTAVKTAIPEAIEKHCGAPRPFLYTPEL